MNIIWFSILVLGAIGLLSAIILYFVSKKFKVEENPLIEEVAAVLPNANCGGCSFAGCADFAKNCVLKGNIDGLNCPVGGAETMQKVAAILGCEASTADKKIATLICAGDCNSRKEIISYTGIKSCSVAHSTILANTLCTFGCLGYGDCEAVCTFGAIKINPQTKLPEIDATLCTACGACVKACPKTILSLKKIAADNLIYVACNNKEKGASAMKACKKACIGCSKCVKECPQGAIKVENFVAFIDEDKCTHCGKCALVCPTGAIKTLSLNA